MLQQVSAQRFGGIDDQLDGDAVALFEQPEGIGVRGQWRIAHPAEHSLPHIGAELREVGDHMPVLRGEQAEQLQADGGLQARRFKPELLQLDQAVIAVPARTVAAQVALQHLAERPAVVALRRRVGQFSDVSVLFAHGSPFGHGF